MKLTHTTLALATGIGLVLAGPALAQDIVDDELIDEVVEEVVAQDQLRLRLRLREDGCVVDPTYEVDETLDEGEIPEEEIVCPTQLRIRTGEENGQGMMYRYRYEDEQPEPRAMAFGFSDDGDSSGGGGGRGRK